jgi:hypothetical protein
MFVLPRMLEACQQILAACRIIDIFQRHDPAFCF